MNWDDLRFFLAVSRAGSLRAAANDLGVDQSTVSRRIAALESSVESKLFSRTREGLQPTSTGLAMLAPAAEVEAWIDRVKRQLAAAESTVEGELRIATSPVFADYFLLPRMARILADYPQVRFDVASSIQMVNLPRGEADVAIRLLPIDRPPGRPTVLARKLCTLGFALYGSERYLDQNEEIARPVTSLEGHQMIAYRRQNGTPGGDWLVQLERPPQVVLRTNGLQPVCRAVLANLGLGVLPCIMGDAEGLVRVSDVIDRFNVWIVTNPEGRDHIRIQTIKNALAEMIAAERELLEGMNGAADDVRLPRHRSSPTLQ